MAKKGAKATRRFAKSGELKRQIDTRRKHQKLKKEIGRRKAGRGAPVKQHEDEEDEEEEEEASIKLKKGKGRAKAVDFLNDDENDAEESGEEEGTKSGMTVDDLLGGDFMNENDDESEEEDDDDYSSLDDLEDEENAHKLELSALAERDPEFYKYLQENDKDLLNFSVPTPMDVDAESDDGGFDMGGENDDENEDVPELTSEILQSWQKAILDTRSLRAFRKLLVAFRSAARANDGDEDNARPNAWKIDDPLVFNKLVVTTLKYTPVVLAHHIPYKSLPNGKFKPPTQTAKLKALQKLLLSHTQSLIRLVSQLSDPDMQHLAVKESTKLTPYITTSRKVLRAYLKMCLELWSTADDKVRVVAVLAMRQLMSAQDESITDMILKGSYMTLVRSCKSTTAHSLPSITLMKNSASELYAVDHAASYQHAFGYVRQLAVHLRNSMKVKSKEAYRQVYNWQFAHSVDFWALVLAKACDTDSEIANGGAESELRPLIYPLVQVTLGAIRLIPTPRYHPFHLHLTRSLLHISIRSRTYIPLPPLLLPLITSTLSPATKSKASTLRPLDLSETSVHIRAPAQYLKTRTLGESVCEEAVFLLGAWSECWSGSVAFPEMILPVVVVLKRALKKSGSGGGATKPKGKGGKGGSANGKNVVVVKTFVERVEDGMKWITAKRESSTGTNGVDFAPGMRDEVERWEEGLRSKVMSEGPIAKWMKVVRKAREKKKALVEKANAGESHIMEDDDED